MGVSTDAILAYGYDLGGSDGEWKLHDYEGPESAWLEDDDFIEAAEAKLNAAGIDGDVEIDYHCHGEYTSYILTVRHFRAWRGRPVLLTADELSNVAGYDEKLHRALEVLGITPKQDKPCWVLASYWDG